MTTQHPMITMIPSVVQGQTVQWVDARTLHDFLGSRQNFSDWIKSRICKYGFEEGTDYLRHNFMTQVPHMNGLRSKTMIDYHLTLDMAKELAMVERTPRGRQARQYFIECERQLKVIRDQSDVASLPASTSSTPLSINLRTADIHSVNRQAWADVAGENTARFHARREELLRQQRRAQSQAGTREPMKLNRPSWTLRGGMK